MKQSQPDSHFGGVTLPRRAGNVFVRNAIAIALGLLCLGSVAMPQESSGPGIRSVNAAGQEGPDMVVSGSTGTVGMDADHADELVFSGGQFHSRECSKLGFRRSETKVKRDGDVIHFSAVNVSPEYGTLTWEGVIREGVVHALYIWKKERMFWTIQRQYWFSGTVNDGIN